VSTEDKKSDVGCFAILSFWCVIIICACLLDWLLSIPLCFCFFFVFHCTPKQKSFNLPWIVCATNYHATATRSRPFLLPTRRPSRISWSAARATPSLINWLTKGKHSYSNNNWRLCWSNFPTTTNNREISFTPYPRLHPPFFWHALSSYSKTFSF